ncbi:AAA family ATPase [Myxococcus sp. MISCRS1]|uniref:AAA family ATPase n=1 Tax=Myxococcus sp. MISCRS1 TaxID=2996786 RepID=UPI002270CD4B|nr:AAA family ATPase [Myxococcus sp. MISCRS1]MCY1000637.1 AAA family ATPase [Myxococcus sp. MISCRS1]
MLTRLSLENIRTFRDKEWEFPLKPITILCGTNSAGKSTIIKSLLLLQQSQAVHETDLSSPSKLRFAGPLVDMGSYKSLVSDNDTTKDITISIEFSGTIPGPFIEGLGDVKTTENSPHPYKLNSKFTFTPPPTSRQEQGGEQNTNNGNLHTAEFNLFLTPQTSIPWRIEPSGKGSSPTDLTHIIHIPTLVTKQSGIQSIVELGESADKKNNITQVILKGLIPGGMTAQIREPPNNKRTTRPRESSRLVQVPLPSVINRTLYDLRQKLAAIHYIGPLRAPAKRYYVANLESPPGLDSSGEFLPYVLRENANTAITTALPQDWTVLQTSLTAALNHWLQYLRTGETTIHPAEHEIRVSHLKGVLVEFELKAPQGDSRHSLADSGFGYSQILPIIVRGLLAPVGSTLIIEQPELHLNPALQTRLAAFFVAMMKSGKQVILETHSEHIVNSIRLHAAEEASNHIAASSSIYFLDNQASTPVIHDLSIQNDGTVPRWPRHFFGEALTLSARLLAAQRRKRTTTEA